MPNHYTTKITLCGDPIVLAAFKAKHFVTRKDGEVEFDFNTVIPMPKVLEGSESSSTVDTGLMLLGRDDIRVGTSFGRGVTLDQMLEYPWVKEAKVTDVGDLKKLLAEREPDAIDKANTAIKAFEETGHTSWYSWSVQNWGTKWNSYSLRILDDVGQRLTFQIDTAWAPPVPVLRKLTKLYPSLAINAVGNDEGEDEWETIHLDDN